MPAAERYGPCIVPYGRTARSPSEIRKWQSEVTAVDEAEVAEQRPEKRASILPLLVVGLIGLGGGSALGGKALGATVGEQLARRQMAPGGRSGGGGHGGEEIPPLHVIDNLVVNPARSAGTRFLLTSVAIEISPDDAVLLQARDAELRHALIMVLGTKTVEELSGFLCGFNNAERLRFDCKSNDFSGLVVKSIQPLCQFNQLQDTAIDEV